MGLVSKYEPYAQETFSKSLHLLRYLIYSVLSPKMFINVFTAPRHWGISWTFKIQSKLYVFLLRSIILPSHVCLGRAIAQAVSRWLPTGGPGFEPGSAHVGFCGGQSGAGAGFLRVLRFPLPISIPPIAPKIILIYHRGLYNRPKWPQYQGLRYLGTWVDTYGQSPTPPIIKIIKN
jgi:hypothetical protein